jgi:glycosyltransferase involved in cell wall biosynthesis
VKDAISRIYHIPSSELDVIHPGVKAPQLSCHTANRSVQNDGTGFFLAVGALEAHKNYESMFEALKTLVQLHNISARLVVVGEGSRGRLLRSQYRALPICFKGDVSTDYLSFLYSASRCLIHTAYWEPFGLTPLEAAYFGKPSIVSKIGGPRETVLNGVTGIHVDPSKFDEICSAMSLMMNSDVCAKMGEKARENVRQNFTMEKMAGSLEKVLEHVY